MSIDEIGYYAPAELTTEQKLDLILLKISQTEAMVTKIIEEVKPTLDELMGSQLFKMIGMGKKK
jgi:hypothetical protein